VNAEPTESAVTGNAGGATTPLLEPGAADMRSMIGAAGDFLV
jgi:hypothetical protein